MKFRIILLSTLLLLFTLLVISGARAHTYEASAEAGEIRFWGDGTVNIEGKGTLTVKNLNNLRIEVDAEHGEVEKIVDGRIYHHFEGKFTSIGKGGHLEIRGWNIKLHARGRGKGWVRGETAVWSLDEESGKAPANKEKWKKLKFRSWK